MGKKLVGLLCLAGVVLGWALLSQADAANPDIFQIRIQLNRTLGVDVSTSPTVGHQASGCMVDFGVVQTSQTVISSTPIYVNNTSQQGGGATVQTYTVALTNWSGPMGINYSNFVSTGLNSIAVAAEIGSAASMPDFPQTLDITNNLITNAANGAWGSGAGNIKLNPITVGEQYNTSLVAVKTGQHFPTTMTGYIPLKMWVAIATPWYIDSNGANPETLTVTVTAQ